MYVCLREIKQELGTQGRGNVQGLIPAVDATLSKSSFSHPIPLETQIPCPGFFGKSHSTVVKISACGFDETSSFKKSQEVTSRF